MSKETILKVEKISKHFEIFPSPAKCLLQYLLGGKKKFSRDFWALHEVTFELKRGECIGIIGKNGAGKSTLLQIITGVLQPTSGTIETHGRITALLELGSGFNPEFTGRENVYMNAAILGLTEKETEQKMPEIFSFAEIGEFVDRPVKEYSSGMMLRLAFAVQVVLDPDLLIVDEALAVGDALFQRKCYAYIDSLKKKGTSLLLVTHDTETVKQHCDHVVFIKEGRGHFFENARDGVLEYMRYLFPKETAEQSETGSESRPKEQETVKKQIDSLEDEFVYVSKAQEEDCGNWGAGGGKIKEVRIFGLQRPNILTTPNRIKIEIDVEWDKKFVQKKILEEKLQRNIMVGIRFSDVKSSVYFETNNDVEGIAYDPMSQDHLRIAFDLEVPELRKGEVFLSIAVAIGNMQAHIPLVWNDMQIVLQTLTTKFVSGYVYFPTKITFF